ncbi:MAG: metal ABC transporter permease [Gemmobacter sp.]|jgi:manganese/zinc/iron transport system permease protein
MAGALGIEGAVALTGVLLVLAAVPLGLLLVLRGAAMMTDAISHAVVLGIVLVWMATGIVSGPVQIAGAAAAGLGCVLLAQALGRARLIRTDAATGLAFSAFFALGVLLINLNAGNVHIDADTVLLGEIGLVWLNTLLLGGAEVPVAVVALGAMAVLNGLFVALLWKELKVATFDPALAAALGFAPGALGLATLALLSATAVSAFDAVGVVLFVAMTVCPAASALVLTDRLGRALVIALACGLGAVLAGLALALRWDVSIGGMMASTSAAIFALALLLAPGRGVLARALSAVGRRADEDCRALVAHLHTHQSGPEAAEETAERALREHLRWAPERAHRAVLRGLDRGLIRREGVFLRLTEKGAAEARAIFAPWARGRAAETRGAGG